MKLALHRSLTFWSGILVMAFICWAWRDSWKRQSGAVIGTVGACNEFGGVVFVRLPGAPGLSSPVFTSKLPYLPGHSGTLSTPLLPIFLRVEKMGKLVQDETAAIGSKEAFRLNLEASISQRRLYSWLVYFPHRLILLTFAIPWSALLILRARRRKRARVVRGVSP